MSDFSPAYTTLQSEPDNIEVIREQIAALLVLDLENQYRLAKEAEDPNKKDYDVSVFVEKDNPIQFVEKAENPFPLVNVSLESAEQAGSTATVNRQSMTATFYVDVYATGNADSLEDKGMKASMKAWKTARLVRRILRAETNTYLRLRGIVGGVSLSFQSGEPADVQSAIRVKMVRVTAKVDYTENVEITSGPGIEVISMTVKDDTGEVIVG